MQNLQPTSIQDPNKRNSILSGILTVVVLFILGKYLLDNPEIFASLQNLNFAYIGLLILINVSFILVLSFLNKMILQKLEPKIKSYEIVSLQFVNNLLNKILPKGGVAYRALYLKQRHQLSYSYFLATFTGIVVVSLSAQALISLGAFLLIYLETGLFNLVVFLGFLAILLGTLFIMILRPSLPQKTNRVLNKFKTLFEGWKIIVEDRKDLSIFIIISVVILLIDALNIYTVFYALGIPVQYYEAVILSSLSMTLSYINITPDGLGVREGVYLYISSILTLSEPQILLGSLVQRGAALLSALIFGGMSYLILRRTQRNSQKSTQA
jgi:uncharacterized protein (TIRG00374 family)